MNTVDQHTQMHQAATCRSDQRCMEKSKEARSTYHLPSPKCVRMKQSRVVDVIKGSGGGANMDRLRSSCSATSHATVLWAILPVSVAGENPCHTCSTTAIPQSIMYLKYAQGKERAAKPQPCQRLTHRTAPGSICSPLLRPRAWTKDANSVVRGMAKRSQSAGCQMHTP